jgi:hypothetical protein
VLQCDGRVSREWAIDSFNSLATDANVSVELITKHSVIQPLCAIIDSPNPDDSGSCERLLACSLVMTLISSTGPSGPGSRKSMRLNVNPIPRILSDDMIKAISSAMAFAMLIEGEDKDELRLQAVQVIFKLAAIVDYSTLLATTYSVVTPVIDAFFAPSTSGIMKARLCGILYYLSLHSTSKVPICQHHALLPMIVRSASSTETDLGIRLYACSTLMELSLERANGVTIGKFPNLLPVMSDGLLFAMNNSMTGNAVSTMANSAEIKISDACCGVLCSLAMVDEVRKDLINQKGLIQQVLKLLHTGTPKVQVSNLIFFTHIIFAVRVS